MSGDTGGSRGFLSLTEPQRSLALYEEMLTIRLFEERVRELRLSEHIQGSVHLCIGQESPPVGTCAALRPDDPVYATYRGHGWALASGAPLDAMFAELMGRETGVNSGRGGSAYLSHADSWFMGENSIVGAGAPIAVGSALASKFKQDGKVTVTVFGDGATNQGSVHEALNMAAAFSLPVIFICENNVYSELTPIADMVGETDLSKRAAAYGMAALRLNGNDPVMVGEAVASAAQRARSGGGPTFLELHTYRLCGHYIGDPETYRTPEEIKEREGAEPLTVLRGRMLATGVSEATIGEVDRSVAQRIEHAVAAAMAAPMASVGEIGEHLYA